MSGNSSDGSYWFRHTGRRRFVGGSLALTSAAAFAAACGGSNNNNGGAKVVATVAPSVAAATGGSATAAAVATGTRPPQAPVAGTAASSATAAGETPVRGGTLRRGAGLTELVPDPHIAVSIAIFAWSMAIYTSVGAFNTADQKFYPIFAESMQQPSATEYVFKLRKGVKWHNIAPVNGREVTADDVKYSYERFRDLPQAQNNDFFKKTVDKMEVIDPYTFKLTTKQPYAEAIGEMASGQTMVVAREAVEKFGDLGANFIGAGPYIVDRYVKGEKMVYKRNPDYFDKTLPYIDVQDWTFILDAATQLQAYKTDQIDIGAGNYRREGALLGKLDYDELLKNPKLNNYKEPALVYGTLGLNASVKPFDDKRVRQALWLAFDRQQFIDKIEQGQATPQGVLSNALDFWTLSQDEIKPYVTQDIKKAKDLLTAAGYPNGFDMDIETASLNSYIDYTELVVAELKKVGINAKPHISELGDYLANKLFKANFNATVFTHNPYTSPKVPIGFYHKNGIGDFSWFHYINEDISKAIDIENGEVDLQKRQKLVKDVQKMILDDAAPLMPFITGTQYVSWHKRVGGFDATQRNFQYFRFTEFIKPGV